MKTPPPASIRLGASWYYRGGVLLFAALLIANYLISTSEKSLFFHLNANSEYAQPVALGVITALALLWALWDAWAPRSGALHYAAGDWVLARGDVETVGTLQPVLHLPNYILVRFTPRLYGLADSQLHNKQQQWLHLESRHTRHLSHTTAPAAAPDSAQAAASNTADALALSLSMHQWQAVCRAVHAQAPPPELHAHEPS